MATCLPVIADSEAVMAVPSEVPPVSFSRSMALSATEWSASGRAVVSAPRSNATTPMSTLSGCAATNARAARCAPASRVGATSSAPMLLDTSRARMTVPAVRGTGTMAAGPAVATESTPTPAIVRPMPR